MRSQSHGSVNHSRQVDSEVSSDPWNFIDPCWVDGLFRFEPASSDMWTIYSDLNLHRICESHSDAIVHNRRHFVSRKEDRFLKFDEQSVVNVDWILWFRNWMNQLCFSRNLTVRANASRIDAFESKCRHSKCQTLGLPNSQQILTILIWTALPIPCRSVDISTHPSTGCEFPEQLPALPCVFFVLAFLLHRPR